MIKRKRDLITWNGKTPSFCVGLFRSCREADSAEGQNDEHSHYHASILIASMMFVLVARLAGNKLAKAAMGKSQIGVNKSWFQGIRRGMLHPKEALLTTSVNTRDNAHPPARPSDSEATPMSCDSAMISPRIWLLVTPTARSIPISRFRSSTKTARFKTIPITATNTAITRSTCVIANV